MASFRGTVENFQAAQFHQKRSGALRERERLLPAPGIRPPLHSFCDACGSASLVAEAEFSTRMGRGRAGA